MPSLIPKIIHQTYKTQSIPVHWEESRQAWKKLHPTWEYRFWTDADLRALVETKYPELLPYYDAYPYNIQRVDAARYLILETYGGVYSDLDLVPTMPIDQFLSSGEDTFFALSTNVSSCLTNSLMASAPGAGIWRHVRHELARWSPPVWAVTKHFAIISSTGPMMLDYVFRNKALGTISILPSALFSVKIAQDAGIAAIKTINGSSWCSFDSRLFIFVNRHRAAVALAIVLTAIAGIVVVIWLAAVLRKKSETLRACRAALFKRV